MVPFRIRRGEPYILITVGGPDATNVALDIAGKDGPRCELTVVTTELALSAIVGKLTELSVLSAKFAVGLVFKTWAELLVTIEKSVPVTDAVEKLVEADNSEAELSVCTEVVNCVSERLERELTEGPTCEMLRFEDGIVLDSTIWGVFTKLESGILPLSEPKGDEIGDIGLVLIGRARVRDVVAIDKTRIVADVAPGGDLSGRGPVTVFRVSEIGTKVLSRLELELPDGGTTVRTDTAVKTMVVTTTGADVATKFVLKLNVLRV